MSRTSIACAALLKKTEPTSDPIVIPGGKGKAGTMQKGDLIKVTNTRGFQVKP